MSNTWSSVYHSGALNFLCCCFIACLHCFINGLWFLRVAGPFPCDWTLMCRLSRIMYFYYCNDEDQESLIPSWSSRVKFTDISKSCVINECTGNRYRTRTCWNALSTSLRTVPSLLPHIWWFKNSLFPAGLMYNNPLYFNSTEICSWSNQGSKSHHRRFQWTYGAKYRTLKLLELGPIFTSTFTPPSTQCWMLNYQERGKKMPMKGIAGTRRGSIVSLMR